MNCPHCGASIPDGMEACPACHVKLIGPDVSGEPTVWCESCGSPVPEGVEACPVCGLPVKDAYEDWDEEETTVVKEAPKEDGEAASLTSAIPPAPEAGDAERGTDDAPTHMRLVIVAAIAALLVVGGTTLYITRPWDPNAYITHATEDADTSMEGFPGTVTHLSGQDLIEDSERTEYLKNAERTTDDFMKLMGEVDAECAELEVPVEDFLETGLLGESSGSAAKAESMRERFETAYEEVAGFDMRGSSYEERHGSILVTAEYLQGRVRCVCDAWTALESFPEPDDAIVAVRAAVNGGVDGRSLAEWRDLFVNSYATLTSEEV